MEEVEEFVKESGYSPVYIVTGIKIARGPAVSVSKTRKRAFKAEAVVNQPAGVPGNIGAKSNSLTEDIAVVEFKESDDFVIGIRVNKVRYRMKGTAYAGLHCRPSCNLSNGHCYRGASSLPSAFASSPLSMVPLLGSSERPTLPLWRSSRHVSIDRDGADTTSFLDGQN
ncbi:hypothetical protein MGU_10405 [Metarhizium guizhouense ARSEF 977]|uniref:Uncharacterized protein n=1 Tax=Metarhizium guizhouense (strain ARSEF 977) TaxID=1276136 RepID=A0A0B4GXP6_METGA|nr:hypothetical protein MGU_10405 [Metarhizium guizhouense ARSEF 977]